MNVGFKIKELRRQKGWLQRELGDRLNVNQQTVSGWENGAIEPTISKLKKIADVFGVKVDYFKDSPDDGKDQVVELIDKLIAQGKIKSPEDVSDDLVKLIIYAVKMDIQTKLLEQD